MWLLLVCTRLEVINTCDETDRPCDSVATSFALPSGFERISKSRSALDWSSYIPVNTYHRLHGRIVPVLFTLHAILYLNFLDASGIPLTRLEAHVVQWDLAAISSVSFISVTSLPTI